MVKSKSAKGKPCRRSPGCFEMGNGTNEINLVKILGPWKEPISIIIEKKRWQQTEKFEADACKKKIKEMLEIGDQQKTYIAGHVL